MVSLSAYRPVQMRRPQHTGEHVWVEPLVVFLRRRIWLRPENRAPLPARDGVRQVGEQRFGLDLDGAS